MLLTSVWTKSAAFGRLGWARAVLLGFVPQSNLQKSGIWQSVISTGETQQVMQMSFRSSTNYP